MTMTFENSRTKELNKRGIQFQEKGQKAKLYAVPSVDLIGYDDNGGILAIDDSDKVYYIDKDLKVYYICRSFGDIINGEFNEMKKNMCLTEDIHIYNGRKEAEKDNIIIDFENLQETLEKLIKKL